MHFDHTNDPFPGTHSPRHRRDWETLAPNGSAKIRILRWQPPCLWCGHLIRPFLHWVAHRCRPIPVD